MKAFNRWRSSRYSERGAILILVAGAMFALLGVTAFAVDFGRFYVARNELQNVADAAALSGISSIADIENADWDAVCDNAELYATSKNKVQKVSLASGDTQIELGYWDADEGEFVVLGDCENVPDVVFAGNQLPAARVSVARSENNSVSGPLQTVFAPLLGVDTLDVEGTAIAAVGRAERFKALPMGLAECASEYLFDANGKVKPEVSDFTIRAYQDNTNKLNDLKCYFDSATNILHAPAQWMPLCAVNCTGKAKVHEVLTNPSLIGDVGIGDPTEVTEGVTQALANAFFADLVADGASMATPVVDKMAGKNFDQGGDNAEFINFISLKPVDAAFKTGSYPSLKDPSDGLATCSKAASCTNLNYMDFVLGDIIKSLPSAPDTDDSDGQVSMLITKAILVN